MQTPTFGCKMLQLFSWNISSTVMWWLNGPDKQKWKLKHPLNVKHFRHTSVTT